METTHSRTGPKFVYICVGVYIHVCMFKSFCSHFNNGVDMTIKTKML